MADMSREESNRLRAELAEGLGYYPASLDLESIARCRIEAAERPAEAPHRAQGWDPPKPALLGNGLGRFEMRDLLHAVALWRSTNPAADLRRAYSVVVVILRHIRELGLRPRQSRVAADS